MEATGRSVVITGGGGGVGRRVTERWIATGSRVLAVDARQESLDALRRSLGAPARLSLFAGDLTTEGGATAMAGEARKAFGKPADTLIHLVGGFAMGRIDAPDAPRVWDKMFALNLATSFHCYRALLPGFREIGGGWIVGLAARAALQPGAQLAAYAASKAALIALTKSLAAETRGENIHVNVIVASTIDTPANRAAMGEKHASDWVTPDDIADATLFLCSGSAKAISGAAIEVYAKA